MISRHFCLLSRGAYARSRVRVGPHCFAPAAMTPSGSALHVSAGSDHASYFQNTTSIGPSRCTARRAAHEFWFGGGAPRQYIGRLECNASALSICSIENCAKPRLRGDLSTRARDVGFGAFHNSFHNAARSITRTAGAKKCA